MTDGYTTVAGWPTAIKALPYITIQMNCALSPLIPPALPRDVEEAITKAHV